MSAQLPPQSFDDADLLAAEYVLGVLDANGLREARRRLRSEAGFARDVSMWEGYFSPWIASIAAVDAPDSAWPRIAASLGWSPGRAAPRADVPVQKVGFWRGLAFGALALAGVAGLALVLTLQRAPAPVPKPTEPVVTTRTVMPDMVAAIAGDDGKALLVASIDSASGAMTLAPAADVPVPAGKAAELWLIAAGGTPQSLGVIDPARPETLTIPEAMRAGLRGDALLAVSIEPTGGSPTGQPTGPVIAKGAMRAV